VPVAVRSFRRSDRDQLTELVNAHVAAVVPGMSVSVSTVLAQLEREPGEFVVDPWVVERTTLVAEQRGRVVAGAHLLRYRDGEDVGESYRGAGEIRWLLCAVDAPYWPDAGEAGRALTAAAVAQLEQWGSRPQLADGSLPAPGVYGVPEQWPHVAALLEEAGFTPGRRETVLLARVADLPGGLEPPHGATLNRSVGINGTRLEAPGLGFVEVDLLAEATRAPRLGGWADVGNLRADDPDVALWLLSEARAWLELGGVERLLDYHGEEDGPERPALLERAGFRVLATTQRGWVR
jgi:hypothetical protein